MLTKIFFGLATLATLFVLITSYGFYLANQSNALMRGDDDILAGLWLGIVVLWFMWGVLRGLNKRKV